MSDMNINATGTYTSYQTGNVKATETTTAKEETSKAESTTGVVYEKSEDTKAKVPYSINKMSAEERASIVEKMKQENENRKSQLASLVSQMLQGQAGAANLASLFKGDNLKNFTAADIAQAKEDISEDGYYGVKNTSQRLFDFAAALAGDDVDKMKEMQEAMMKGFEQAKKAWGEELPDISKQTIDAANKLFDDYYASKAE